MSLIFSSLIGSPTQGHVRGPWACHPVEIPSLDQWSSFCQAHDIPVELVVHAAWALVVQAYTVPGNEVTLGLLRNGRIVTRTVLRIKTIPLLISNLRDLTLGLGGTEHIAEPGTQLSTSVVTTTSDVTEGPVPHGASAILSIGKQGSSITLSLRNCSSVMPDGLASMMARTLKQAVSEIMGQPSATVDEVSLTSPIDIRQILQWNQPPATKPGQTVHGLISEKCHPRPHSMAICAWDGNLTYRELDALSDQLAKELIRRGSKPGDFIPLYMAPSTWAIVALLAVIKAGSAFLLLDVTLPLRRLRDMCSQVSARIVVCSESLETLAASLAAAVVPVGGSRKHTVTTDDPHTLCKDHHDQTPVTVGDDSALYAVFTSGSTGKPKCVVISHRAFTTAAPPQISTLGLDASARVLQFSSFAFDASISEILYALMAGSCLCVPSTTARQTSLAAVINQFQVNWAILTPTVARLLSPADVPGLHRLTLVGEPVTRDDIINWTSRGLHLIIGYGPSECTPCSALHPTVKGPEDASMIGQGCGASLWITDPQDPSRLVPIGAPGELLIEGPSVGCGYLGDPEKTATSFIDAPRWLRTLRGTASPGKLYRTGDLVRYVNNGQIRYLGRKDAQVKLHGQRIELEEIEHQIKAAWDGAAVKNIVAEIITPADAGARPVLAAFILQPTSSSSEPNDGLCIDIGDGRSSPEFRSEALRALEKVRRRLPRYMVPSHLVSLSVLPLTPGGKIDRRQLRLQASQFSRRQLMTLGIGSAGGAESKPTGPQQCALISWIREVLAIPSSEELGVETNLFHIGMDSIVAIKLVARARAEGVTLDLGDIFEYPIVADLAQRISIPSSRTDSSSNDAVIPFALLPDGVSRHQALHEAQSQCGVSAEEIEDIYPCTPVQEGIMSQTAAHPEMYATSAVFELSPGLDIAAFQAAWEATATSNPILRTRIIVTPGLKGQALQVVMRRAGLWRKPQDLRRSSNESFGPGQPLIRLAIDGSRLTVAIHHAIYDGWSFPLILEQVERAYSGKEIHSRPFSAFIRALGKRNNEAMDQFWRNHLQGLSAPRFPSPQRSSLGPEHPAKAGVATRTVDLEQCAYVGTSTLASAIQLAWALTVSQYTGSPEVLMGQVSTGRSVSIPAIDQVTGPTIAVMPVRLILDLSQPVGETCDELQRQAIARMPFEHVGLQQLRTLSDDCAAATDFRNLLVVQPQRKLLPSLFGNLVDGGFGVVAHGYDWVLECQPAGTRVAAIAHFNRARVDDETAARVLGQFTATLARVRAAPLSTLREVSGICPDGLAQVRHWNKNVPSPLDRCVPDMLHDIFAAQPHSPAIAAWDGQLTYRELERASDNIAVMLVRDYGVRAETFVPICVPRSKWAVIAMVGVIRAGGAFVLLESSFPRERLQSMCRQVQARVLLTTAGSMSHKLVDFLPGLEIVALGDDSIAAAEERSSHPSNLPIPAVAPSSALYAVFTSGSTGSPKGVVINHSSFATNVKHGLPSMILGPTSRVLQFASHAFDASVAEVLFTLTTGGCVCVPHERDRADQLTECINSLRVTTLFLTPSVARTLNPGVLPTVKTLVLVGEPMTTGDVSTWAARVHLVNSYGPAECTTASIERLRVMHGSEPTNIGTSSSAGAWVIDPDDPEVLVPLGASGELLIEGPIVGRGYIDDADRTRTVFTTAPQWLRQFRSAQGLEPDIPISVYRTGDMVQYSSATDGSLLYIGRKDKQIKLRGQRIELSEVECHILRSSADVGDAIVELATPPNSPPLLVAFIRAASVDVEGHPGNTHGETSASFRALARVVHAALLQHLPSYMLPSKYISIQRVPLTTTGKVDRRQLRDWTETLPTALVWDPTHSTSECGLPVGARWEPTSDAEQALQQAVAHALGRQPEDIALDQNFFQLGGDSLGAMRLIASLRTRGFRSVRGPDLHRYSTLSLLAENIQRSETGVTG